METKVFAIMDKKSGKYLHHIDEGLTENFQTALWFYSKKDAEKYVKETNAQDWAEVVPVTVILTDEEEPDLSGVSGIVEVINSKIL